MDLMNPGSHAGRTAGIPGRTSCDAGSRFHLAAESELSPESFDFRADEHLAKDRYVFTRILNLPVTAQGNGFEYRICVSLPVIYSKYRVSPEMKPKRHSDVSGAMEP